MLKKLYGGMASVSMSGKQQYIIVTVITKQDALIMQIVGYLLDKMICKLSILKYLLIGT